MGECHQKSSLSIPLKKFLSISIMSAITSSAVFTARLTTNMAVKKAGTIKAPAPKKGTIKKFAFKKSAPVKKATIKKAIIKKAPIKKAPIKKAPIKKAPFNNPFAKKAPVKKAIVKKAPVKKVVKKPVVKKKVVVKKAPARRGGSVAPGKSAGLKQWYGPDRKLFLPIGLFERNEIPSYLNGTLAGDYGFDPLGLGQEGKVDQYRQAELIHARWAMLAIPGCLIPEIFNSFTDGSAYPGSIWWETGKYMLPGAENDGLLRYVGATNPLPLPLILVVEVGILAAIETYRKNNEGPYFGSGADPVYPGGKFDPLGLADDPEAFAELRVKEIKNGRLALVSMLGFGLQALVTQEGPYANWLGHVSDPVGYNLFTVLGSGERVPTL